MNPILLQKQLKENANDLNDFCKDLQSWGEEMKRKEDSLKSKEDSLKKSKIDSTHKAGGKVKREITIKSKIGPTDYAKWDKFDADLECEHLEDDIKDDSELTDEFEESFRDEALVHKEKGNSYVKTKEWDKAIECYTKAIKCYCYDPIFFANRALCHLKKQNYTAAEEDCTLALRLDETYVKALQRRAAARECLGKLELAKRDLENVLIHEPKNKESIAALESINKKLGLPEKEKKIEDQQRPVSKFTASRNKSQSCIAPTSVINTETHQKAIVVEPLIDTNNPSTFGWPDPGCEIIPVKAIDKPPHLRSKKPLKRIDITEIASLPTPESHVLPPTEIFENTAVKKHVVEKVRKVTFQEYYENASEPIEVTSAFKKRREKVKNEINENLSETAWPKPDVENNFIKSDDLKILEKKLETDNTVKDVKNTENLLITKISNKNTKDIIDSKHKLEVSKDEYSVPKTSVQFYTTWKCLKTQDDKYKYLRLIDPSEIPNLFQESLESNVFSSILDILSSHFIEKEENVYKYLIGLTNVKRFSALTMFMDSNDKNCLWKIIAYLREQGKVQKEDVDNLILKYEL